MGRAQTPVLAPSGLSSVVASTGSPGSALKLPIPRKQMRSPIAHRPIAPCRANPVRSCCSAAARELPSQNPLRRGKGKDKLPSHSGLVRNPARSFNSSTSQKANQRAAQRQPQNPS
ncbi:hypothetical protein GGH15_003561 [Coemansia sp. RSA 562]|nr:hypothetical protein GGH15_003561 [Coemansia sp. RSA 562]